MAGQFDHGDAAWILTSTALVFLMIPGLGYFYSGMAQTKNALSLITICCVSIAIVAIEWFLVGYSFTFSTHGGAFIGTFHNAALVGLNGDPSVATPAISDYLHMLYQFTFAAITPALAVGAAAERGRLLPSMIFVLIWSLVVYNFVAYWTWNPNGWGTQLGVLDYAGGTPVHITSGFAALIYSIKLGVRSGHGVSEFKPHNMSNVMLGTSLLWFGWFGFNGGSALAANTRAAYSVISTNLAASAGGLTWMLMDYMLVDRKYSALGFCSGAVAGLVAITPAAGYVEAWASIILGIVGAIVCNFAVRFKQWMHYDDALDVFAVHGVGGIVGSLLTGIFASAKVAGLDPDIKIAGGWVDGNWMQILYQLADICAAAVWSALITYIILTVMDLIPGLEIRVDDHKENLGLDLAELGMEAYPPVLHVGTGSNSSQNDEKIIV
ncbi:ammonium transporter 2 [Conidiobolus coronatus NRRL 28638]|uniref:Ammonium transporter n=1 Tax=Conidiobolus coronatus (strain ATCC 28846 / CBS 209.66 / NRRL 28638) TaxID=796925 RepID=A0A137P546_CONC2|nr:ammonium transporter 2 [Conidiobolus coronatus NRRL 28638]|eukprot:KXN70069.1 ammonium transporter 2 [Conidiobolus coronatus NRRL 28638]